MPQSLPETVLSPRSSLSSSPFSSTSSIDSPLMSDSISDWTNRFPRDSEHRNGNHRRRPHTRSDIHSPASSRSRSLSSSASGSDSVPLTPWNVHPDHTLPGALDRRQVSSDENPNFLDGDEALDENNIPPLYMGHTRWRQTQGTPAHPPANLPGDSRTNAHVDRTLHRKSRSKAKHRNVYYEPLLTRDFFLILTLCFVLACFLICLTRPALISWVSTPSSLLGLDE